MNRNFGNPGAGATNWQTSTNQAGYGANQPSNQGYGGNANGPITPLQFCMTLKNMLNSWLANGPENKTNPGSHFDNSTGDLEAFCENMIKRWHTGESSHPNKVELAAQYSCDQYGTNQLVQRIQEMAAGNEFTDTVYLPSGESSSVYQMERNLQEAKYSPKSYKPWSGQSYNPDAQNQYGQQQNQYGQQQNQYGQQSYMDNNVAREQVYRPDQQTAAVHDSYDQYGQQQMQHQDQYGQQQQQQQQQAPEGWYYNDWQQYVMADPANPDGGWVSGEFGQDGQWVNIDPPEFRQGLSLNVMQDQQNQQQAQW